jgi:hypothetical protein
VVRCYTRALKNARFLREAAPEIFARNPSAEGFGTGVPLEILRTMHRIPHQSPILNRHQAVAEVLRNNLPPIPSAAASTPFTGTIHFTQVTFRTVAGDLATLPADMDQIIQFAQHAMTPISKYVAQYGESTVRISPAPLAMTVSLPGTSFSDADLRGWVNDLAGGNGLGSGDCVFVVVPQGVSSESVGTNSGYHNVASVPYIVAGVFATGLTMADNADRYEMVVSHEIAEMTVDPNADGAAPEVCDPCDLNCGALTRCYFSAADDFLGANHETPPGGFPFSYYICAIVRPAGAGGCPAPPDDCQYAPASGMSALPSYQLRLAK